MFGLDDVGIVGVDAAADLADRRVAWPSASWPASSSAPALGDAARIAILGASLTSAVLVHRTARVRQPPS